ncbi:MAG: MFS transporter [Mycobacterium sp.]|jgi:MFS family permease|nr:MFS transporter [Mycobacterium sp.]
MRAGDLWRGVRRLPDFWRLLELRTASQFADGLFQAGLAGGLLFNPERAADPLAIAGAFAVLFLPYSMLGPFAGALLDRWDRRSVLIVANAARLVLVLSVAAALAAGVADVVVLCLALIVNGFSRFVTSGLSAALPDVVPREQVVTMNSVATATGAAAAFLGANFMLVPRRIFGAGDTGAGTILVIVAVPVAIALLLSLRFSPRVLGPTRSGGHGSALHTVATGWAAGTRVVRATPSVAATLAGLAAHRMVFGINTLLVLVLARNGAANGSGLGTIVVFVAATGGGAFLATLFTPAAIRRWGRYASVNAALLSAAVIQLAGATLYVTVLEPLLMVGCGFLLGVSGQVIKLCADSAMQIDVDDTMRGHVFAVQDSLFWISFIASVSAAATVIPADGRSPMLAVVAALLYLAGFAAHARTGRLRTPTN